MPSNMNVAACVTLMQEADRVIRQALPMSRNRLASYTIGGGALRDSLLGRPVKDIDVCITTAKDFGLLPDSRDRVEAEGYVGNGVVALHDLDAEVFGHPIQLIERRVGVLPAEIAQYHVLHLSDVFWHLGALHICPGFVRDAAEEVIRVKPNRRGKESVARYLGKVRDKYPWEVVQERSPEEQIEDILGDG